MVYIEKRSLFSNNRENLPGTCLDARHCARCSVYVFPASYQHFKKSISFLFMMKGMDRIWRRPLAGLGGRETSQEKVVEPGPGREAGPGPGGGAGAGPSGLALK